MLSLDEWTDFYLDKDHLLMINSMLINVFNWF